MHPLFFEAVKTSAHSPILSPPWCTSTWCVVYKLVFVMNIDEIPDIKQQSINHNSFWNVNNVWRYQKAIRSRKAREDRQRNVQNKRYQRAIRSRKARENRQRNVQNKRIKRTNNYLQDPTKKTRDWTTRTPLKTRFPIDNWILVSFAMNFQYGVKCYFIYNKLDIDPQGPVTIFTRSFLNPYIYYYTKKGIFPKW